MEKLLNKLFLMLADFRYKNELVKLPVRIVIDGESQYRNMYIPRKDYNQMKFNCSEDLIAKLESY